MSGRPWTDQDLAELQRAYGREPVRAIAARLGRTMGAVYNAAGAHELADAQRPITRRDERVIRRLNRAGYTDTEIAQELGRERHTVSLRRKRLGLPCQRSSDRRRLQISQSTRRQCQRIGVDSLGQIRALSLKIQVIRSGWPPDLEWRSTHILDLLEKHGPMTRRQLVAGLGMVWRGRDSLKSNGPRGSYLAELVARGLVLNLGRVVKGVGKGKSVYLYSLALGAERRKLREG